MKTDREQLNDVEQVVDKRVSQIEQKRVVVIDRSNFEL